MFDIFEEKEQPKLYIADMVVEFCTKKVTKKQVIRNRRAIRLDKQPILLTDGKLPTKNYERRFFKKVFENQKLSGSFDTVEYKVLSIDNAKYSSNISYKFDYDKH